MMARDDTTGFDDSSDDETTNMTDGTRQQDLTEDDAS
jgi:hypothetical protein